jgi:hypothetical protein
MSLFFRNSGQKTDHTFPGIALGAAFRSDESRAASPAFRIDGPAARAWILDRDFPFLEVSVGMG